MSHCVMLTYDLLKFSGSQYFCDVSFIEFLKEVSWVSFPEALRNFDSLGFLCFSSRFLLFFLFDTIFYSHTI